VNKESNLHIANVAYKAGKLQKGRQNCEQKKNLTVLVTW
jgi:hypothetical protein